MAENTMTENHLIKTGISDIIGTSKLTGLSARRISEDEMQVNIHEAKTRLSELLQVLEEEEEIIIANRGTPVARLLPYREREKRKIGLLKGQYEIPEDIDECNDEIAEMFGVNDEISTGHTCDPLVTGRR